MTWGTYVMIAVYLVMAICDLFREKTESYKFGVFVCVMMLWKILEKMS